MDGKYFPECLNVTSENSWKVENIKLLEYNYSNMGKVLDVFLGDADRLDSESFDSIDHRNAKINPESTIAISTAEIRNKSDLLKVEDAVISGHIVLAEVGVLSKGITKEDVVSFLVETIEELEGDISWRSRAEEELIIVPNGVNINRKQIT